MSGFVGVFHRDGRPVDDARLAELTAALRFRGPDGTRTWHHGAAGLGHARFVTHPLRDGEAQPLVLDERLALAGQIRLDAREDLIAALRGAGDPVPPDTQDASLVLRAYRAWGEGCVQRLHGDFAFGIWDAAAQAFFCARDLFGVRPFFYAEYPDLFVFGNTLGALRAHPRVGDDLDERALADFLLCGYPLDPALSFLRDIRRLPAAHWLSVTTTATRVGRYRELAEEPVLRCRHAGEYVERLHDVLARAVADRAGQGPVGISLSGGLDSGAIAAALAGRIGPAPAPVSSVRAYCSGWNCAFEDPEPRAAAFTAAALGIPLEVLEAADGLPLGGAGGPEPSGDYFFAQFAASLASMASTTRINLDGQGADEIFAGESVLDEAGREPPARVMLDALRTWTTVRRPPLGLRNHRRSSPPHVLQQVPRYLAPAWQRDLGLAERLRSIGPLAELPPTRGRRATARARLQRRIWGPYLEGFDAGFTGVAIETRWPYLDERVVRFALSLPPLPWCVDKHLLRRSVADVLPAAVAARPKSPLAGDPLERFVAASPQWAASAPWHCALDTRVVRAAWLAAWHGAPASETLWQLARPLALAHWLRRGSIRLEAYPRDTAGTVKSRHARSPVPAQVSDESD